MSGFEIQVTEPGFEEARRQMAQLEDKLRTGAVRAGLNQAAKPILETMQQLVPVRQTDDPDEPSGRLKRSLGKRSLSKSARARLGLAEGTIAMRIGPVKKVDTYSQAFVGKLVEFGVEPSTRTVYRRIRGTKHLRRRLAHVSTYTYHHPGQDPQPFMAPALERNSAGFEGRFYQGLRRYLDRKGVVA